MRAWTGCWTNLSLPSTTRAAAIAILRLLGDLIRELDGGGVVSGALLGRAGQPDQAAEAARVKAEAARARRDPRLPAADRERIAKNQRAQTLAAHSLHWLAGALDGPITNALNAVVAGLVGLAHGRQMTDILDPLPSGSGRRPPSLEAERAAWPEIVRLTHFKAGLDGRPVIDTYEHAQGPDPGGRRP